MTAARGLSGESPAQEGKYRVLVELGQGGTAIVYLAVARGPSGFNKLVVLKALKKNLSNDPEFRNMFLNEARLAARLNHPNIVQTNEVAEDEGVPVIVMEYLEGQPLSNILIRGRTGALSLAMHLRIITDSLAGLHYAHEVADFDGTPLGVVHRDMTPHNVFVTFEGQVKVLDFGIAKLGTSLIETQAGVIKGKLRYMPPEQISGEAIDRRADIYAVGVMLWEAAAGERLWKGHSDATIMNRVLNGEIPSPREKRPEVPEELERICMKALAADRNNRYPTAADLESDLEALIASMPESRITGRQIGKVVDKLFEDVRVRTKALVEAQLSKVASLSWAEYQASQQLVQAPTMTFSNSTAGSTISDSVDQMMKSRKRTTYLPWLGGAAAMLLFLFLWRTFGKEPPPIQAAPPPTAATAVDPPPDKPTTNKVQIRLSASPPEAKLFFDNEQLPTNPYAGTLPADGVQHTVRAEAPNYSSSSTAFILDRDADIVLALEHSKGGAAQTNANDRNARGRPTGHQGPAPAAAPPAPAPAPPSPPTPTTAKPDCNPPYFVDQRGIKRYKPECM
jgi:serine/threonine-protein kinase